MVKIAPSILSADFSRLGEHVKEADKGGADLIHVDVMDGHFVPNITIGPVVVKWLRGVTDLPLDCHLMITQPDLYIPEFKKVGADWIAVHQETCPHLHRTIQLIHGPEGKIPDRDVKAGVALNPSTPFSSLENVLGDLDFVVIMTVNPGFGGQKFIESILSKIEQARDRKKDGGFDYEIQVDGGVSNETIKRVVEAGGEVLVAGNAAFGGGDVKENISGLRDSFK